MLHSTKISIVAAMDEKRGIGKNNDLLFRIPQDFKRMQLLTTGHPIIMGRKTFESIGRVLPKRTNIIITRDAGYKVEGAVLAHSLEQALELAKKSPGSDEIFIFGGGQIFEQALPFVDKLYLTIVEGDFGADTFFPDYSIFRKKLKEEKHQEGQYSFTFLDLEK
ncbi:MAG TPA: dihydrofolate reductase [Candidatus Saccharimonadales bacterium]|nr:dihydrofolate reductase [Candidatus Saccharimonadales bacterium]